MPNGNGNGKHHLKKVRIDDLLTFSPITKTQEKHSKHTITINIYFFTE